jgi:hypothetical protein
VRKECGLMAEGPISIPRNGLSRTQSTSTRARTLPYHAPRRPSFAGRAGRDPVRWDGDAGMGTLALGVDRG